MVDAVGDLAFAQEALADLRLPGELRVEDLHGRAGPVAVLRRKDRAHAAHAEEAVE